jgi:two-component system, cell cycle response regulator
MKNSMGLKEVLKDYSVLYVEDEDIVRETLKDILARRIDKIYTAENGKVGLDIYKAKKPDIVITDIRMPLMDGITMAKEIKLINPDAQIIITTAHNELDILLDAIETGITQYLIKPIRSRQLINSLEKVADVLNLKRSIEKQNQFIQNILNFQDNIILVTDGFYINTSNKAFLDFFGFKNIEEFRENHKCICEFFIEENSFIYKPKNPSENWIENIIKNKIREPKVKMKNRYLEERIFIIKFAPLPEIKSEYIISFTDVTELENQRLTFKALAYKDPLTKINNRLRLDIILEKEIEIARKESISLALIMFDIDFFKKVNDNYGHDIGDYVLVELTNLIKVRLRDSDMFARWGGEEFMIVLPKTDAIIGKEIAERLRVSVETHHFEGVGKITCSFGISELMPNDDFTTFLKRVDDALYKAKRSGRNRVEQL